MVVNMKMDRSELTAAVLVSTNSVLGSMTTFNMVLTTGLVTDSMISSLHENSPYYKKAMDFAESVMVELDPEIVPLIQQNLSIINDLASKNSDLLADMNRHERKQ
jgi:hypothetical protein